MNRFHWRKIIYVRVRSARYKLSKEQRECIAALEANGGAG